MKKPTAVLDAPEQAIDSYLAALLREVEEYEVIEPKPVIAVALDLPRLSNVVAIRQGLQSEAPVQVPVAIEINHEDDTTVEVGEKAIRADAEIVPDWGMSPFQCLPFRARGMNLVIPLTSLCSIVEWNQELTHIPGQPDWYMGVFMHRDQHIVVVDTAQLIMPDRLERVSDKRPNGSHILVIGDGRWGLACDSLQSPLALHREAVRWRRGEGSRPWMAGTVIEQLSVLLNVDALLEMVRDK